MTKNKYFQSHFDHYSSLEKLKNESFVYLLYIDEMLIVLNSKVDIKELKVQLRSKFGMKNFGVAKKALVLKIERNRMKKIVCLS